MAIESDSAERHARMTLHVLSAAKRLPAGARLSYSTLGQDGLHKREVLGLLARVPKPVACRGKLMGDVLEISVTNLSEGAARNHSEDAEHTYKFIESQLTALGHREGEVQPTPDNLLDLQGTPGRMQVTLGEMRQWLQDYAVVGRTLTIREPDEIARRGGAVGTILVSEPVQASTPLRIPWSGKRPGRDDQA